MNRFIEFYDDVLIQIKNILTDLIFSFFHLFKRFFKKVQDNDLVYTNWTDVYLKSTIFGGNQAWFPTRVGRDSGCGVTSASDITAYLAKYNDKYEKLYEYDKDNFNKDDFLKHMEEVYKYLPPTKVPFKDKILMGVPLAESYKRGVKRFAKSKGINLKVKIFDKPKTIYNIIQFIKEGLSKDRPVAMIQWENEKLPQYKFHWMTITKLKKNDQDDIFIYCLTWGRIEKLDLYEVINPKGVLKRFNFLYIE